jgi:ATP-dependent 26S proteasome regulatory subunit
MNRSSVSLSALLNVLDGAGSKRDLITIITSNYIEKLDVALIRPGRIDMIIEFDYISKEQIDGLLKLYNIILNEANLKLLTQLCVTNELTPSVLSSFMFRNRKKELNDTNYINMFKKYLKEINVVLTKQKQKKAPSNMYA